MKKVSMLSIMALASLGYNGHISAAAEAQARHTYLRSKQDYERTLSAQDLEDFRFSEAYLGATYLFTGQGKAREKFLIDTINQNYFNGMKEFKDSVLLHLEHENYPSLTLNNKQLDKKVLDDLFAEHAAQSAKPRPTMAPPVGAGLLRPRPPVNPKVK